MLIRLLESVIKVIFGAFMIGLIIVLSIMVFPPLILVPAFLLLIPVELWIVIVGAALLLNWKYIVKGERKDDI